MITLAAVEAASRPAYVYQHLLQHCMVAVGSSASLTVTYYILMVSPTPGGSLTHLVPVIGVLLAHVVHGVGSGIAALCHECVIGRDQVEVMLSLGESRTAALAFSTIHCVISDSGVLTGEGGPAAASTLISIA